MIAPITLLSRHTIKTAEIEGQPSEPVLDIHIRSNETVTLLRAKTHGVNVFMDAILSAAKDGKIIIERIGEARWEKAWALIKKYQDKPDISFVDFTSFVVMKEAGISEALTADKHYEDVGMGLKKLTLF